MGYISEVDDKILQSQSDVYKRGDYIGKTGIEADYEAVKELGIENPEAYDFNKILNW